MPLTPLDFKVFGPKQFPDIHRAARLVQQRGRAHTALQFAAQLRQMLLSKGIAVEWVDDAHTRLLVGRLVWVQVIEVNHDLDIASHDLREIMHQHPQVLMAYIVRIGSPLDWRHIQISAKWLDIQTPREVQAISHE